jgi:hypothetical protein
VIGSYGQAFEARYGRHLSAQQERVLRALANCRTATLGGHVEQCDLCAQERIAYNSCRNRHCPKCQGGARARWLEREASYLLPVEYHHVVFTLPAALAPVAQQNARVVYNLLFAAVAETVQELAADPHYLGAQVGLLAVLHTWGQNLHHHPHVHCVVTGGGLSCDANGQLDAEPRWLACRPGFFLPVRVLSRLFRGKFLSGLRQAYDNGKLSFHGRLETLRAARAFAAWLTPLYRSEWVVYAKPPLGRRPEQVLKYLARYTHRVAISNDRLLNVQDGQVSFRYKDYADDHQQKTMTLAAEEFLRRFLVHVLPKGFVKIRHYGLLTNRRRAANLERCRRLLLVESVAQTVAAQDTTAKLTAPLCPWCGQGRLQRVRVLFRVTRVTLSPPQPSDSS